MLIILLQKDYETFLWHIFKFGILVHDPRSFVGWAKKLATFPRLLKFSWGSNSSCMRPCGWLSFDFSCPFLMFRTSRHKCRMYLGTEFHTSECPMFLMAWILHMPSLHDVKIIQSLLFKYRNWCIAFQLSKSTWWIGWVVVAQEVGGWGLKTFSVKIRWNPLISELSS